MFLLVARFFGWLERFFGFFFRANKDLESIP